MTSGIYQIRNLKNNRRYIGSAVNLQERKVNHFSMLRNNKHTSIILQRAYNKMIDKSNLVFEVLEYCNIEELIDRENHYLDLLCKSQDYVNKVNKEFLKLSYNILPIATKGFSGKHRKESIEKSILNCPFRKNISIYNKEGFIKEVLSSREANIETKVSRTSILKACKEKKFITKSGYYFCFSTDKEILESNIANLKIEIYNKGKKYTSDEIKSKFKHCTTIRVKNIETREELQFYSQMEACKFFKLQPCTVNRCLKTGKPYKKYLKFNYYKDIV